MPEIIRLGLDDAIRQAVKDNADLVTALPHDEASIAVTDGGVSAVVGVDAGSHVTFGGWLSRSWSSAASYGAAMRVKWGGK